MFSSVISKGLPKITELLTQFELEAGQSMNIQKSGLFFSSNTPSHLRRKIKELFVVSKLSSDNYGSMLSVNRNLSTEFSNLSISEISCKGGRVLSYLFVASILLDLDGTSQNQ